MTFFSLVFRAFKNCYLLCAFVKVQKACNWSTIKLLFGLEKFMVPPRPLAISPYFFNWLAVKTFVFLVIFSYFFSELKIDHLSLFIFVKVATVKYVFWSSLPKYSFPYQKRQELWSRLDWFFFLTELKGLAVKNSGVRGHYSDPAETLRGWQAPLLNFTVFLNLFLLELVKVMNIKTILTLILYLTVDERKQINFWRSYGRIYIW